MLVLVLKGWKQVGYSLKPPNEEASYSSPCSLSKLSVFGLGVSDLFSVHVVRRIYEMRVSLIRLLPFCLEPQGGGT